MVMTVVHGRCFLLSRTSTWPFLAVEEFFQPPPWYATVGRQLIAAVADADGEANWSRPQSDQTDHRECDKSDLGWTVHAWVPLFLFLSLTQVTQDR